ncbi:DUF3010 family protein [Neptunomonas japonica]|uniref:DUF3010 domain-containing protein n=1 Tax=Neptunomonas japonica JAMM 1380 TaxID=1441457 RepID=A0A7R6PCF8_9GAMM|nr:DUF3010 family protein [Neptunomonas japonica]BBB29934.1 conserved hypothetical protein [Neptunomonas japonica JAMM 1380]
MRVCGVEFKNNEAIVCLLSLSDGLFDIPDCRTSRITLLDSNDRQNLKDFQFSFNKLMTDYKVEKVIINQAPMKGKFSGGGLAFKMEATLQLSDELDVVIMTAPEVKEVLKRNPLGIPFKETGLKEFQQAAFNTAYAYQQREMFAS